jgi:hypothetical protein
MADPSSRYAQQHFDYTNQAWTMLRNDDVWIYVDCGHPAVGTVMGVSSPAPGEIFKGCECYGKVHQGKAVPEEIVEEMWKRETERNRSIVSDAAINAANAYYPDAEECEGQSGFDPDW